MQSLPQDVLANYKNALEILSQSTDDFLFLFDIGNDENWFFGPVDRGFALRDKGIPTNTTAEMLEIIHPADRAAVSADLAEIAEGKKDVHNMNYRWIDRHGNKVWINCRGKVIRNEEGKPIIMVGRVSEEALRHMYNPLTGLFNKVKLAEDLAASLQKADNGYLMLLDIDDLAAINLSHGRAYGDELLKELASTIESTPLTTKVYHIDHNYFAVMLNARSERDVKGVYNKLRAAMIERCTLTAGVVPIDSSVFIDGNSLYDSAKIILRQAKNKGKASLEFFSRDEVKQKILTVKLLEELQESVNNNFEGFCINYQPQVRAGSYHLFSAEALVRYNSKSGERVFPNEFIPLLEQSKLIIPVGMWILERSLLACKEWRKTLPDMRISVNFSAVQFKDEFVVEKIREALVKTGMPGEALTIELTESIPLSKIHHFTSVIKALKASGIQIAIDDFGTGYSNIGYLKQLDVDEIKIDRMFVAGVEEDTYNYRLISNTLDFAKMNSIRVCCEGVETERELAVLESRSPDIIQGYLFDKPCEAEAFREAYLDPDSEKYKKRISFIKELYRNNEKMSMIRFDPKDILRETDIGLWIIRINEREGIYELHADDTMERIMGVDRKYTPEECYKFWYGRIKEDHLDYVQTSMRVIAERGILVQLQYPWIHPELGEVIVRSNGKRVQDSDGMIVLEGYHRILSNIKEL